MFFIRHIHTHPLFQYVIKDIKLSKVSLEADRELIKKWKQFCREYRSTTYFITEKKSEELDHLTKLSIMHANDYHR